MKLLSDVSTILRLAAICLIAGVIFGLCMAGAFWLPGAEPSPSPTATVRESRVIF